MATLTSSSLSGTWPMVEVLRVFPAAQRALSQKYDINPLVEPATAGFQPADLLATVAMTHRIDVDEVIEHIKSTQDAVQDLEITPREAAELMKAGKTTLLDVREPEAFVVASIPGSRLVDEALAQEIVHSWPRDTPLVIVCHHGVRSLDAAEYLRGQGFARAKSLARGIDAWSLEIDPSVPRY